MAVTRPSISPWDYVVFAVMLLVTLFIGVFYAIRGKKVNTSEYLMGNRNLNFLSVSVSMVASIYSAIFVVGFTAEAYLYGGIVWLYAGGIAIGAVVAIVVFVPVFHPLKLTSVNEYLHKRFQSRFVAALGTVSSVVGMLLVTSVIYFAPATTIEATTGFPTWASILAGSAITIIYTSIGGIRAVIWTDVFQTLLMFIGLLTICIQAISKVGGLSDVWEICRDWERLHILNINPDPTKRTTFWSVLIGTAFLEMIRFGIQQMSVQRYCSLPTLTKAKLGVLLLVPWITVLVFLSGLSGLAMFAYYTALGCDPLKSGQLRNPNQILPYFVTDILNYPGIPGIFVASVAAASLSTASSCLNSSAANLWKDVLCVIWPNMSDKKNIMSTKVLVVVCGIVSTAIAFGIMTLGGTLVQMIVTFTTAIGGPTMAMFLLGIFVPFANWLGASAAGLVGVTFSFWMGFGAYTIDIERDFLPLNAANCSNNALTTTLIPTNMTTLLASTVRPDVNPLHQFYSVSYLWIGCFSTLVSFAVGLVVSLVTGRMRGQKVPSDLFHPWVRYCYRSDGDEKDALDKPVAFGKEMPYVDVNSQKKGGNNGLSNGYKDKDIILTRM